MKNKKKIILIVVGILVSIGIIIGTSYAWWTYRATQSGVNTIQSNCLAVEIVDETEAINIERSYPLTDKEAEKLDPYTFTIQNKCNTSITYDVSLEIMESKDEEGKDNRLASEYIAISFDGAKKVMLDTLEETTPTYQKGSDKAVEGRYLVSGELGGKGSQSYTIKLWIDEHVEVEDDAMNKNFRSKIVVDASLNPIAKNFNEYIMEQIKNNTEIEEFSHAATDQTEALTDYRYVGANPKNYVYFGCEENEESPCTEDNLYRIIGIIPTQSEVDGEYENRVKLLKAKSYGTIYGNILIDWKTIGNTTILNTNFWNELGEYQKYIEDAKWYLGDSTSSTLEGFYNDERSANNYSINKIALLYPSDYWSSSSIPNCSSISIFNWNISSNNCAVNSWIYGEIQDGYCAWLLNRYPGRSNWYIHKESLDNKGMASYSIDARLHFQSYPTFYLKANVLYKSGNGTQENPFRIGINE